MVLLRELMGDQDDREAVDLTNCLPALFPNLDAVLYGDIADRERQGRDLKAESVLPGVKAKSRGIIQAI